MHVVPSGKRRQMERQEYDATHYGSDLIDNLLAKLSAVGLGDPNAIADQLGNPAINNQADDGVPPDLQQTLNQSDGLPRADEGEAPSSPPQEGKSDVIDISDQLSQKVIDVLGLNKRPNESWAGETNISRDGQGQLTRIVLTLKNEGPPQDQTQDKVTPGGPPLGVPVSSGNKQ